MFYRFVYVWDVNSRSLQYKLPGHMGSVNEAQFYPDAKEPIGNYFKNKSEIFKNHFSGLHGIRQGRLPRRNSKNLLNNCRATIYYKTVPTCTTNSEKIKHFLESVNFVFTSNYKNLERNGHTETNNKSVYETSPAGYDVGGVN